MYLRKILFEKKSVIYSEKGSKMKSHKQKLLLVIFFSIGLLVIGMNMNRACGLVNNQTVYLDDDPNEPEPEPEIVAGCRGFTFMEDDPNEPEPEPEITFMGDDPNEPEPEPEVVPGCLGLTFMEDDPNEPEPEPECR